MKKFIKNITAIVFLLAIIFACGVSNSEAARFGHRSGADMKIIASLGLSSDEQTALKSALSTNGPAVKTAMQNFHAAKKKLNTDLKATPPVGGSQLAADAAVVADAKAQLKAARTQLNGALLAAISTHLKQLQDQLTAQFQSRLDAKTSRLLFEYTRHLEKQ